MSSRRRRRRAAPPPSAPPSPARWSRLATASRWWLLAGGLLAGRLAAGLPGAAAQLFDFALAAGVAFLLARAYRRWARRRLGERARQRVARGRD